MAYAQWVHILIQMIGSGQISVKNASLAWGKWYRWDNKDAEISTDEVNAVTAGSGQNAEIASCGRSDASSGCEGNLDLYDGNTKVCHIYFDCPWGSKTNTFTVSDINGNYVVQNTGANLDGGALGTVEVKVVKIA